MPPKLQPTPEQRMQSYYDAYVGPRVQLCLIYAANNNEKTLIIKFFLSAAKNIKGSTPQVFLQELMTLLNALPSRESSPTTITLDSEDSVKVFTYLFKLLSNTLSETDLENDLKLKAIQRSQAIEMSQALAEINQFIQRTLELKLAELTGPTLTTPQYMAYT